MANKDYDYFLVKPIEFTKYLNKLRKEISYEKNNINYFNNNWIDGW